MIFDLINNTKLFVLCSGKDDGLSSFLSWLALSMAAEKINVTYIHSDVVIRPYAADYLRLIRLANNEDGALYYLSEAYIQRCQDTSGVCIVDDFSKLVVAGSARSVVNALCAKFDRVIIGVRADLQHSGILSITSATSDRDESFVLPDYAEVFSLNRRGGVTSVESKLTSYQFQAVASGDSIVYRSL